MVLGPNTAACSELETLATDAGLTGVRRAQVAGLMTDLHAPPTFARWITKLAAPWLLRYMQQKLPKVTGTAGTAPMDFAPAGRERLRRQVLGKYAHRVVKGGVGHNLPREAPAAFAQAIMEVDRY